MFFIARLDHSTKDERRVHEIIRLFGQLKSLMSLPPDDIPDRPQSTAAVSACVTALAGELSARYEKSIKGTSDRREQSAR